MNSLLVEWCNFVLEDVPVFRYVVSDLKSESMHSTLRFVSGLLDCGL